jgi:hypothetical protein
VSENQSNRVSHWLLPISLIADISAVVTVLSGSASVLWLVLGSVALLLGLGQLALKFGKPVDLMVLVAVLGIVLGTVAITVGAMRSVRDTPQQAAGSTTSSSTAGTPSSPADATTSSTPPSSTPPSSTPPSSRQETEGVRRSTPDDRPILLTTNHGLDLDLGLDKPWVTVLSSSATAKDEDLVYKLGFIQAEYRIAAMKSTPDLDACVHAGWQTQFHVTDIAPGDWFCVKTTEGAFGRMRVREKKSGQLTLDVLVWSSKS